MSAHEEYLFIQNITFYCHLNRYSYTDGTTRKSSFSCIRIMQTTQEWPWIAFLHGQSAVRSQTNVENEKYHNLYKCSHNKTMKSSLIKALLLPVNPNPSYYMVKITYFKYITF